MEEKTDLEQAAATAENFLDKEAREKAQLDSFFEESETEIAGLKLRGFSLGTVGLCEKLGLSMMTKGADGLTNDQVIDQVVAFAWMQSEPLGEVLAAVRGGPEVWESKIEEFRFKLEIPIIKKLMEDIQRIARQAAASSFELQKKTGPRT